MYRDHRQGRRRGGFGWVGRALLLVVLAAGPAQAAQHRSDLVPPKNPFLADSFYPIGHTNSAQVDSTAVPGPAVPSHHLKPDEMTTVTTGPGHLVTLITGAYPGGRRVVWSNSAHDIVKLDYDSLQVMTTFKLDDAPAFTDANAEEITTRLKAGSLVERLKYAGGIVRSMLPSDLASVYTMLDRDNLFYVGRANGLSVYGDAKRGDPASPIALKRSWTLPAEIPGRVVGMNMTYDGWIVLATDAGVILTLSRDFSAYHYVWLPHSDEAAAYNARLAAERPGDNNYNWIRNSIAVDDRGGIYVAANDWMEKVVWNGHTLSADPKAGGWAERYPNSTNYGTGATPVLMGFGKQDRFVVITDGDKLMAVTLFWRDAIPPGWKAPDGALSPRIAGALPVTMGDPGRKALQSEQAVVVAGYDMMVVNNEPASMPPLFPARAKGLLISLFGDDPAFTPHGLEKFTWDPAAHALREAWANTEVASPNCVPYASTGSNRVYTVGVRDGEWTLESLRLDTGASAEHYALGGARFNTMFSGIYVDDKGRVTYGGMFGSVRLAPAP
jgi:hypothetical protein